MCYMDKKEEEGKEEGVNLVNWLNKVHNEERRRGECDLQDEAREYGGDRSRRREKKRGVEDKERGKVVKT